MRPYKLNKCFINKSKPNICLQYKDNEYYTDHPYIINNNDKCITLNTQHCYYQIKDKLDNKLSVDNQFCEIKDSTILEIIIDKFFKNEIYNEYFILLQECSFSLINKIINTISSSYSDKYDFKYTSRSLSSFYINDDIYVDPRILNPTLIIDDDKLKCRLRDFNNYNITIYNKQIYSYLSLTHISSDGLTTKYTTQDSSKCGNIEYNDIIKNIDQDDSIKDKNYYYRHHMLKFKKGDLIYLIFNVHYRKAFRRFFIEEHLGIRINYDHLGTINDGIIQTLIKEFTNEEYETKPPIIIIGGDFNKTLSDEIIYKHNELDILKKKKFGDILSYFRYLNFINFFFPNKERLFQCTYNIASFIETNELHIVDHIFLFKNIDQQTFVKYDNYIDNDSIFLFELINEINKIDKIDKFNFTNLFSYIKFIKNKISKLCVSIIIIKKIIYIIYFLILLRTDILDLKQIQIYIKYLLNKIINELKLPTNSYLLENENLNSLVKSWIYNNIELNNFKSIFIKFKQIISWHFINDKSIKPYKILVLEYNESGDLKSTENNHIPRKATDVILIDDKILSEAENEASDKDKADDEASDKDEAKAEIFSKRKVIKIINENDIIIQKCDIIIKQCKSIIKMNTRKIIEIYNTNTNYFVDIFEKISIINISINISITKYINNNNYFTNIDYYNNKIIINNYKYFNDIKYNINICNKLSKLIYETNIKNNILCSISNLFKDLIDFKQDVFYYYYDNFLLMIKNDMQFITNCNQVIILISSVFKKMNNQFIKLEEFNIIKNELSEIIKIQKSLDSENKIIKDLTAFSNSLDNSDENKKYISDVRKWYFDAYMTYILPKSTKFTGLLTNVKYNINNMNNILFDIISKINNNYFINNIDKILYADSFESMCDIINEKNEDIILNKKYILFFYIFKTKLYNFYYDNMNNVNIYNLQIELINNIINDKKISDNIEDNISNYIINIYNNNKNDNYNPIIILLKDYINLIKSYINCFITHYDKKNKMLFDMKIKNNDGDFEQFKQVYIKNLNLWLFKKASEILDPKLNQIIDSIDIKLDDIIFDDIILNDMEIDDMQSNNTKTLIIKKFIIKQLDNLQESITNYHINEKLLDQLQIYFHDIVETNIKNEFTANKTFNFINELIDNIKNIKLYIFILAYLEYIVDDFNDILNINDYTDTIINNQTFINKILNIEKMYNAYSFFNNNYTCILLKLGMFSDHLNTESPETQRSSLIDSIIIKDIDYVKIKKIINIPNTKKIFHAILNDYNIYQRDMIIKAFSNLLIDCERIKSDLSITNKYFKYKNKYLFLKNFMNTK